MYCIRYRSVIRGVKLVPFWIVCEQYRHLSRTALSLVAYLH